MHHESVRIVKDTRGQNNISPLRLSRPGSRILNGRLQGVCYVPSEMYKLIAPYAFCDRYSLQLPPHTIETLDTPRH